MQDIQKIASANRMREVVRHTIYPFLLELNDNIGYTKIFLQTAASTVESVYTERQSTLRVSDLLPRLNEIFTSKDEAQKLEYEKYRHLFDLLKDETLRDFNTMIQSLPRAIETYFTQQIDKNSVMDVKIDEILGK